MESVVPNEIGAFRSPPTTIPHFTYSYLTYNKEYHGIHTFLKGISPNVN